MPADPVFVFLFSFLLFIFITFTIVLVLLIILIRRALSGRVRSMMGWQRLVPTVPAPVGPARAAIPS